MFKSSKKINKLFLKFSKLVEKYDQDENDFLKEFIIFDTDLGVIKSLKEISKIIAKAKKDNVFIYAAPNHFDYPEYCYLFIGHENEILIKIQSGIDKLLDLQKQYDKEYKEEMKVAKAREIANLKAKLKRLESSK